MLMDHQNLTLLKQFLLSVNSTHLFARKCKF